MDLRLEQGECAGCDEEILVLGIQSEDRKSVRMLYLQPEEVEVFDADGNAHRGHERHWKYCTARPTTGSASAEPPDEPPDEPDKVLNE